MTEVGLKDLLQAGVHFGHQTHRWNPKMRKYIFAERGGIYLIDLQKTLRELNKARDLVHETVRNGQNVLFVCTKPQLAPIVRAEAEKAGAFYVTERWLGGMLTNFQTIKKNIRRLKELERGAEDGSFEFYTKKEQLLLEREREKLDRYLSGIKDMTRLPGLVFVVDAKKEEIAVREANRLGIPVVAIADTNADPDQLTIAIAGNDDAIRSVSLISGVLGSEIESARRESPKGAAGKDEAEVFTYSTETGEAEADSTVRKKKRPKRRPKPELIKRRLHPTDPEPGAAAGAAESAATAAEAEPAGSKADDAVEPADSKPVEKPVAKADEAPAEEADPGDAESAEPEEAREDGGSP
ncbi:MAG: 30S ribosomal protein S2 [marine benthic group bacterium]|nr:30S ribosomal protein S2 [Gemmatimonadota bacterium]MCL7962726.1 30S ribosomal protein S2 [Candidatus Carthagonibacter metallireducens]MCL7937948.1 30S ribosomal protein S2 [Gemmatimonadota bacterium]MCL7956726.1 30S ribosomal protein S2 [Gemmatimonadota bacterium]MCL7964776.1 30S ribosomal protein S2 [Gemmatimonadota bacterium]